MAKIFKEIYKLCILNFQPIVLLLAFTTFAFFELSSFFLSTKQAWPDQKSSYEHTYVRTHTCVDSTREKKEVSKEAKNSWNFRISQMYIVYKKYTKYKKLFISCLWSTLQFKKLTEHHKRYYIVKVIWSDTSKKLFTKYMMHKISASNNSSSQKENWHTHTHTHTHTINQYFSPSWNSPTCFSLPQGLQMFVNTNCVMWKKGELKGGGAKKVSCVSWGVWDKMSS